MFTENYRVRQQGNVGLVQGYHFGDNVFYDGTKADLTLKHISLETHNEVKAKWQVSGTCDWLLQKSDFQQWERMETEYSFLWLHGRRGCGKSTMMSRIIESIYENQFVSRNPDSIHLLYFYVGQGDEKEKDKLYRNMLVTFWQQAIKKAEGRPINIFGGHYPPEFIENELHKLLVSSQRDVYIVIDALDQLPHDSQHRLIEGLNSLVQKFKAEKCNGRLSVAISSRDCDGIEHLQTHNLFPVEITAENNKQDIEKYLKQNLRSDLFERKPALRKQVFEELNKKADGMFLWVSLQTSNICRMKMESQILNALKSIIPPQNIHKLYESYAEEFETTEEPISQQIAQRTVALLAHNSGSMSKDAILEALSLDATGRMDQELHKELDQNPTTIIVFCSHLIRINENLGVFQFCHETVFDFFRDYKTVTYNQRIAELCLSHLCSPDFSHGPRSDATWYSPGSLGPILRCHPFLQYASSKWPTSVKESFRPKAEEGDQGCQVKVLNWLEVLLGSDEEGKSKENLQLAFQVYLFHVGKTMPRGVCHEHIISYFALVGLFETSGWFDLAKCDGEGLTPIHWAIRNETGVDATATVTELITHGADINAKDSKGRTPMYYAAHSGNIRVIRLLIKKNAELDLTNQDGETALIAACRKHNESVVLCLVGAGADVKIESAFGTALQAISVIGCCECAGAILGRYGNSRIIENHDPFGTSLHAAAFYGHSDLVKLLCTKRTNRRATHRTYGSPITAAATGYNPGLDPAPFMEIIQVLIAHGAKVNDRSGLVGPALRAAAYHGSPDLVKLLLEKGAKVRKAKGPMGTAYEAADERGHQEVKDILLMNDAKAARYAGSHSTAAQGRQLVQRRVFNATVKASSMETINSLITQFEKFFEKEIPKGDTPFLRGLAKLGEDCFQDVIKLATRSHNGSNENKPAREHGNGGRSRFRDTMLGLLCIPGKFSEPDSKTKPAGTSPHLLRAASTFVVDGLGEHFQQVLDRMTQAAVKILEIAIASENETVIGLIANTWGEALNNLVSYPGFGESMLEMVVKKRADDLKDYLTDPNLSLEERLGKAKALALVGIELLLTAVERGQRGAHLAFVISKLWVRALNDVEDLGEEGEAPIQELIHVFSKRFSNAIRTQDRINAETCGHGGIELVRTAAMSPKTELLDKLSKEWMLWWGVALEGNMEYMVKELVSRRWKEYQRCIKDNKYEEARGLEIAGITVLRTAFKHENESTISTLQPYIESGFQLIRERYTNSGQLAESPPVRNSSGDVGILLNALIRLLATSEEKQPDRLRNLTSKILDFTRVAINDENQLKEIINNQIEGTSRIVIPAERKGQLIQISRAILFVLDVALCSEDENTVILSILKDVALESLNRALPRFTEMEEVHRYRRAIMNLNQEN
ncbi:uncharacterized protein F4822DRAFT_444003 [Hypoxylon trugodes]|uniref:uncharacterized protein n=1 Tax=Hypoxylon trugodes TaxID=326681 RepID=UPI002191F979|nr:uncharacterized protein F4822DRAFT_444003 [Hypoxylon trugodes]KAI1387226.1 hypothetical protein F4822DRAFT_444003 [Hypoxylon trugodes]